MVRWGPLLPGFVNTPERSPTVEPPEIDTSIQQQAVGALEPTAQSVEAPAVDPDAGYKARYGERLLTIEAAAQVMHAGSSLVQKMCDRRYVEVVCPDGDVGSVIQIPAWSLAKYMAATLGMSLRSLDLHCGLTHPLPADAESIVSSGGSTLVTIDGKGGGNVPTLSSIPPHRTAVKRAIKGEERGIRELPGNTVLTTGEVAKILQVAPRTVAKEVDHRRLRGYRIGSGNMNGGDRRVLLKDLMTYMVQQGIPLELLGASPAFPRIVLFGKNIQADVFQQYFPVDREQKNILVHAETQVDLGAKLVRHRCMCLIVSGEAARDEHREPKDVLLAAMRADLLPGDLRTALLEPNEILVDPQQRNFELVLLGTDSPMENARRIYELMGWRFPFSIVQPATV